MEFAVPTILSTLITAQTPCCSPFDTHRGPTRLLAAPELIGLFLNACRTEELARKIHEELPHLSVVCWRSRTLDAAAKAFSRGFFEAIAAGDEGTVSVGTAFDAGRALFLRAGFKEGDPDDYLHPLNHEHCLRRPQEWRQCSGCNPPVHGEPALVSKAPSRLSARGVVVGLR